MRAAEMKARFYQKTLFPYAGISRFEPLWMKCGFCLNHRRYGKTQGKI